MSWTIKINTAYKPKNRFNINLTDFKLHFSCLINKKPFKIAAQYTYLFFSPQAWQRVRYRQL